MTSRVSLVGFAVTALAVGLWVGPAMAKESTPDAGIDLSGTWVLDEERSEDPRSQLRGSGGFGDGRGGGGRGGGGGGRFGGGRGGGGGGGRDPEGSGQMRMGDRMTIEQDDLVLKITDDASNERTIYLDDREISEPGQSSGRWQKGKLIVRTEGRRGQLKETLELAEEGAALFVTISAAGPTGEMKFKRVYTREAEGTV